MMINKLTKLIKNAEYCTGEGSLSSHDKVVEVVKGRKYKHKVGSFYSDMFSIIERIGDYIINVSETIKEYRDTK